MTANRGQPLYIANIRSAIREIAMASQALPSLPRIGDTLNNPEVRGSSASPVLHITS